jgi:hypothetical protein
MDQVGSQLRAVLPDRPAGEIGALQPSIGPPLHLLARDEPQDEHGGKERHDDDADREQ